MDIVCGMLPMDCAQYWREQCLAYNYAACASSALTPVVLNWKQLCTWEPDHETYYAALVSCHLLGWLSEVKQMQADIM